MLLAVLPLVLALGPQQNSRLEYVVAELVRSGFSQQETDTLFGDPRLRLYPPRTIRPRKIDWDQFIARLIAPASVSPGSQFLLDHQEALRRAEEQFGVGKEVLAALFRDRKST